MEWEKISLILKEYGLVVLLGLVGLGVTIYGLWRIVTPEPAVVEIIGDSGDRVLGDREEGEIVVDVAGAVEKPGLYKLPAGSRIGDVLVSAGGLAATADREWVAKNLNLAQEAKDGGKVFIPTRDEKNDQSINAKIQTNSNSQNQNLININTASVSELDSLWGVGEARAKTIIANRPYASLEELVSKAKLPENVYEAIKEQVTLY